MENAAARLATIALVGAMSPAVTWPLQEGAIATERISGCALADLALQLDGERKAAWSAEISALGRQKSQELQDVVLRIARECDSAAEIERVLGSLSRLSLNSEVGVELVHCNG
jgi:hypothetical protein